MRPTPTLQRPPLPIPVARLIAEAKRRMRRRRVLVAVLLLLVVAATATGVIATRAPAGSYVSIAWTSGHYTQMRYCRRPDHAGAFLAASAGVTCQTAEAVIHALATPSCSHSPCQATSFRCAAYWSGRFRSTFQATNHALCSDGTRRVVWDGG